MSIRWKIAALCILVSVPPILFLNRYTVRAFDRFTRRVQEERMISYAFIVGDEYLRQIRRGASDEDFTERLRIYETRFDTRLQIIDPDGVIIMDSSTPPASGERAGGDREIRRALDGMYGARSALTDDRQLMYYYVALPVRHDDGEVVGAVRAIAHTRDITRAIYRIRSDFRRVMLITVAGAACMAVLLSLTITRRLRRLTHSVHSFARGDSRMQPVRHGRDEVGALGRAFETLAGEISRNNRQQGNLLASTTHELKTPLTAIQGAAQILRDETAINDPVAREKFLSNIETSSERLLRMVEQLAGLSKLKAEELRGRKERVAFGRLVRQTVERLFPSPPVPIDVACPAQDPVIPVIPERIEQVLANLLENALRYTPAEGRITVTVRAVAKGVETVVRDNGSGIEPSDLPHVFKQFYTTVPKNSVHDYGSGLGLAIAQSIIQNHGGYINAQSRPGQGSVFTFFLPS